MKTDYQGDCDRMKVIMGTRYNCRDILTLFKSQKILHIANSLVAVPLSHLRRGVIVFVFGYLQQSLYGFALFLGAI